jgi:TRAP-type C4-dicarboxylate transport system substrate-binding protein
MFVVMNKAKWESLPADIQKVFTEVSAEFVDKHGKAWDDADAEGQAYMDSLSRTTIKLPETETAAWQTAVAPVLKEYVDGATQKGLPGQAVLDDIKRLVAGESL